jgi:hypothetical protein
VDERADVVRHRQRLDRGGGPLLEQDPRDLQREQRIAPRGGVDADERGPRRREPQPRTEDPLQGGQR